MCVCVWSYRQQSQSPGKIKRREMELDSHRGGQSFASGFSGCFSDTAFVTLLRAAVGTVISEARKLLRTGRVPITLTLLFWRWPTVSSVFAGRSARKSYSSPPHPPTPDLHGPNKLYGFVDVKHHVFLLFQQRVGCT